MDWAAIRIGAKTEFRTRPREGSRIVSCNLPTPVVAYATSNSQRELAAKLMVLTERNYEPLFNIAEDEAALAREGFDSYDLFRRYWRKRNGGRYDPMQRVWVWRVRVFTFRDEVELGVALFQELYQEHLPPVGVSPLG